MIKPVIPIVFAANDKYAIYCYLAIYTVIKNSNKDKFYYIYVFQTNISDDNCKMLESLSFENIKVECIDISKYMLGIHLKESLHLSIETYYRLFIPFILPQYEKILYLDSDMCVLSDVADLYDCNLCGYAVGAALDVPCYPLEVHAQELGGLNCRKTFNAGVLVIDAQEFEKRKIRQKCLKLLEQDYKREERKLIFADQDALNIVLYDDYFILDKRWNYQPQYLWRIEEIFEDFRQEYIINQENAFVVHFAGDKKPWNYPELPMSDIFWKYAREISEFEKLISCIMMDLRQHEEKLKCFDDFQFPYEQVSYKSKIALYAAGMVGKSFYFQLKASKYAELVLWIDRDWENINTEFKIDSVEKIASVDYDYLVIAIDSKIIADKIKQILIQMNVPENKIVWSEYRKNKNQ